MKNKRILIVEDDPLLALDLEDFLLDLGASVAGPASTVEQALKLVDDELDFAVLDLNLRGTYSFPVIELLQELGIPLAVCSGYAELPGIQEKLHNVFVLPKPCDFDKLKSVLIAQLGCELGPQSVSGKRIQTTSPIGL